MTTTKKSSIKKYALIILWVCVLIIRWISSIPSSWIDYDDYIEQVGNYKDDNTRAFTYYVKQLDHDILKQHCEKIWDLHGRRIVKVFYYDNKEMTPYINFELFLPEESFEYQVSTCLVNKFQDVMQYIVLRKNSLFNIYLNKDST